MTRCVVLFLAVLATAGCAGLPRPAPMPGEWEERAGRLAMVEQWSVRGRIAAKTETDAFNGSVVWTQADNFVSFNFRAPLGVGGFRLAGNDDHMMLYASNGEVWELAQPERELRERTGWSIPLAGLRFWMLGLPDPGSAANVEYGDRGFLRRLEQQGWSVSYDAYKQVQGEWLPHKLVVETTGVRLRLAVDRWHLEPESALATP
jgi:outer membrane lipoprotein LolB